MPWAKTSERFAKESDTTQRKIEFKDIPSDAPHGVLGFHQRYFHFSEAIDNRKKAEEALQQSLRQVEAYSRVLDNELEKGRQMQISFLPSQLLQIAGWETAAFFKPARQVAGDFYDVFKLPDGSIGLVIADVCDKGAGAALFMALFRSLIRIFSGQTTFNGLHLTCSDDDRHDEPKVHSGDSDIDPDHLKALKAVQLTNNYIALNHGELAMFAALFFGILNPKDGSLSYINGGHDPLFIVSAAGGIRARLAPTGPPVGIQPKMEFKIRQTRLAPGDIFA